MSNVENLDDLIVKAGGLKEYAIKERGYLIRTNNGIENEIISFNISNSKSLKLKPEDRVIISSKIDNNRLDVSNLNAGMYVIKIKQNDIITTKKLIIN